jgi:hypothetical protein
LREPRAGWPIIRRGATSTMKPLALPYSAPKPPGRSEETHQEGRELCRRIYAMLTRLAGHRRSG